MENPILTYNNISFYDLSEVELYLSELPTIYERKTFRRFVDQKINENIELYEMAYSRSAYIQECSSKSHNIHYTIANIICLEDICPEMVNRWRKELLAFTKDLITKEVNRSIKKEKILTEMLIEEYADLYKDGYSYLDALVYEKAMEVEIKKASKSKNKEQHIISNFIKSDILSYIDTFVEPNKDRIYVLFNELIKACDKSDVSIFKNALNKFIENE